MSTSSMSSIPFLSLPNPKLTFSSFRPLSFSSSSSPSSSSSSSLSCSSFSKHSNGQRSNQKLSIFACSTSPFVGRVGLQRRQGNASMLSFGINPNDLAHTGKNSNTDSSSSSLSHILSATLPFVVAATAIAALAQPATFTWVSKELYAPALGGIMLSIGIRLSIDDFALAFKRPLPLSVGFIAQYVLKPALGVLIAGAFGMSQMFYAGFVLTSCVAGAQLSSYASFLSKGDVALSILLTSSTTIASVLVTPLLTGLLIGSVVPVDAVAMSKSILQVVLVPVTLGLVLNTYAKPVVTVLEPVTPFVAMICTSMCIGSPLAINRNQILSAEGLRLVLPIFMFHAVAFTVGYWVSKIPVFRSLTYQISSLGVSVMHAFPVLETPQRMEVVALIDRRLVGPIPKIKAHLPLLIIGISCEFLEGNTFRQAWLFLMFCTQACILTHMLEYFTFGNWQEEEVSRTISLCTGMQSSTLAGLLATQFLGSSQAVPPACSVVAMAIMGLCLASFWGSGYRIRDLPSLLMPESGSTVKA